MTENARLKKEIEGVSQVMKEKSNQNTILTSKMAAVEQTNQEMKSELKSLKVSLPNLTKELEDSKYINQQLNDELVQSRDRLIDETEKLRNQLNASQKAVTQLQSDKTEVSQHVWNLTQENQGMKGEMDQLKVEIEDVKGQLEGKSETLGELNEKMREMIQASKTLQLAKEEVDLNCQESKSLLRRVREEKEEMEEKMMGKIESLTSQNGTITRQLTETTDQLNEKRREVVKLDEEMEVNKKREEELIEETTTLKEFNEGIMKEKEELVNMREEIKRVLNAEIESLKEAKEKMSRSMKSNEEEKRVQARKITSLEHQLEEKRGRISEIESSREGERKEFVKKIGEGQERILGLADEKSKIERDWNERYTTLQVEAGSNQREVEQLNGRVEGLVEDLEFQKGREADLRREMQLINNHVVQITTESQEKVKRLELINEELNAKFMDIKNENEEVKNINVSMEEINRGLEDQVEHLQHGNGELRNEIVNTTIVVEELKERLREQREESSKDQSEILQLKLEMEGKDEQLGKLSRQYGTSEKERDDLKQKTDQELTLKDLEIKSLKSEISEKSDELMGLSLKYEQENEKSCLFEESIEKLSKERGELEEEKKTLLLTVEEVKNGLNAELEATHTLVKDKESQLVTFKGKVMVLESEISKLCLEIDHEKNKTRTQRDGLNDEIREKNELIMKLKEENSVVVEELDMFKSQTLPQLKEKELLIETLKVELEKRVEELVSRNQENHSSKGEIQRMQDSLTKEKEKWREIEEGYKNGLIEERRKHLNESNRMETRLNEVERDKIGLIEETIKSQKVTQGLERRLAEACEESSNLQKTIHGLENGMVQKDQALEGLRREVKGILYENSSETDNRRRESEMLKSQLTDTQHSLKETTKRNADIIRELQVKNDQLQKIASTLEMERDELENKTSQLNLRLSSLESTGNEREELLEKRIDEKSEEVLFLKREVLEHENKISLLQHSKTHFESEVEKLRLETEQSKREVEKHVESQRLAQESVMSLQAEILAKDKNISDLNQDVARARSNRIELEESIHQTKHRCEQLTSFVKNLEKEGVGEQKTLREDVERLSELNNVFQEQVNDLSAKKNQVDAELSNLREASNATISSMRSEVKQLEDTMKGEADRHTREVEMWSAQVIDLKQGMERKINDIHSLRHETELNKEAYRQQRSELELEIAKFESKTQSSSAKIKNIEDASSNLKGNLSKEKEISVTLRQELSVQKIENERMTNESLRLHQQLERLKEQMNSTTERKRRLQEFGIEPNSPIKAIQHLNPHSSFSEVEESLDYEMKSEEEEEEFENYSTPIDNSILELSNHDQQLATNTEGSLERQGNVSSESLDITARVQEKLLERNKGDVVKSEGKKSEKDLMNEFFGRDLESFSQVEDALNINEEFLEVESFTTNHTKFEPPSPLLSNSSSFPMIETVSNNNNMQQQKEAGKIPTKTNKPKSRRKRREGKAKKKTEFPKLPKAKRMMK